MPFFRYNICEVKILPRGSDMPQDAFTLRFNAKELNAALKGGKINKINQPEREEISLLIYTGKRTLKLVLNANASDCGAYFTEEDKENPLIAPNFCMLLRKRLQNAEVLEVAQVGFERILAFRFVCTSDFSSCERVLYAEIMGKYSNLLLTENGVILGGLKTTSHDEGCKRVLAAGAKYLLPAPQDKTNPTDFKALCALLRESVEARFLFTHVAGLAPCTAEQIVSAYRGGDFAKHVYDYIFSDDCFPCVALRGGAPVDFFAKKAEGAIPFQSLSAAQSYYYAKKRAKKTFTLLAGRLESAVKNAKKKQEKRLAQIVEKRAECADSEENRIKGELITSNIYALQKGMPACEVYDYYSETGGMRKILLDVSLTPAQNAQKYFKKYQKQKRTLQAIAPQEIEIRAELDYSESLLAQIRSAESAEDLRATEEELLAANYLKAPKEKTKKKKDELPFRTFEKEGFRISAGRNNLQNDLLVKRSSPEDIWLHTQKYHSSHVVIHTSGKAVPQSVLLFAAEVCAGYSDGKQGDKIPVDYCLLKYVKKPPKSKAGFVIYTDHKTLLVSPKRDNEQSST